MSATYLGNENPRPPKPSPPQPFNLWVRFIDYNGSTFHSASHQMYVYLFTSADPSSFVFFNDIKDIGSLPAQPLSNGELKDQLIARGEKFVALRGKHYLEYRGFIAYHPAPAAVQLPVPFPAPGMVNMVNFLHSRVSFFPISC
jgi:hypothetical protein